MVGDHAMAGGVCTIGDWTMMHRRRRRARGGGTWMCDEKTWACGEKMRACGGRRPAFCSCVEGGVRVLQKKMGVCREDVLPERRADICVFLGDGLPEDVGAQRGRWWDHRHQRPLYQVRPRRCSLPSGIGVNAGV